MKIRKLSKTGLADIHRLLGHNIAQLENSQQGEEAKAVAVFLDEAARRFFKLTPERVRPVSAE